MLSLIAHFVGTLGYLGVALLMAVENIIFPLPSELIMPLAGFLAGRRYIPGLRVLISVPAGVARMHLGWFIATNLAGTLIWCALLAVAGKELGVHFGSIAKLTRPMLWVSAAAVVAGIAAWTWHRRHRNLA